MCEIRHQLVQCAAPATETVATECEAALHEGELRCCAYCAAQVREAIRAGDMRCLPCRAQGRDSVVSEAPGLLRGTILAGRLEPPQTQREIEGGTA